MYDVIGDVHGCLPELKGLLERLGYRLQGERLTPPPGRQLVFVGDLVDRGPDVPGTVRLVRRAVQEGAALSVRGNHDELLGTLLDGREARMSAGRRLSLEQYARSSPQERAQAAEFLLTLPACLSLDGGRLTVVHAGERAELPPGERERYNVHGRDTGARDPDGHVVREDWAADYAGAALVVCGHTPQPAPVWTAPNPAGGRTLNLDSGCVYGGQLSALRYPEGELVAVPARRAYAESARFQRLSSGDPVSSNPVPGS